MPFTACRQLTLTPRGAPSADFDGGKAMPAAVLVVHDEQNTRELAVTALRAAFLDVIGLEDPMAALNAIEDDTRIRVLVTRVAFGLGKVNGVALARMVRIERPGTKVVFVARAEYVSHTEGLGVFLPMPLNPDILVETVARLLATRD
jgi:DNA-binding NtrC family response regulator